MSFLYPYQPTSQINDFYESIQAIQESYDSNEGFGKHIGSNLNVKNTRREVTAMNPNSSFGFEERQKKWLSTNSFKESQSERKNSYGNEGYGYRLEEFSTKGSFSSMTSMGMMHSAVSMPSLTNGTPSNVAVNNNMQGNKNKGANSKKKSTDQTDYRKKYKTEPCKYWTEKGYCEYGDQCAFAHGNNEIRQKPNISSNYKTKKCNQFHETGYCPYGVRCQFIHCLRKDCQLNPVLDKCSYTEEMENPELWLTDDPDCICMQRRNRRRLPSFHHVSSESLSNEIGKEQQ